MKRSAAEILREYGPFPGADAVHGLTFDGRHVWFASGDRLNALDPATGKLLRSITIASDAGTAFDGQHLYQIAEKRIQKIDPQTGRVLDYRETLGGFKSLDQLDDIAGLPRDMLTELKRKLTI